MASEIPKHHLKQNVCSTRAPYREGRLAKAVKVYTVNNESCYLLIQGVPSVGAMQELLKLFSTFGAVEHFNPLDEYPCEDKYSEVYLIKYIRIQSARFAKRKLDDYSFFGGALHISYAPEHETLNETREKLQERRRIVAAKIREHANDAISHSLSAHPSKRSADKFLQTCRPLGKMPILNTQSISVEDQSVRSVSCSVKDFKTGNITNQATYDSSSQPAEIVVFELPPPPKQDISKNVDTHQKSRSQGHRFHKQLDTQNKFSYTIRPPIMPASDVSTLPSQKLTTAAVILKDYKPSKSVPRFVPRQAMKNRSDSALSASRASDRLTDALDHIRKNAFQLGETQGPAIVPNRKRELPSAAQQSVSETISEIRNKISKVITESVKRPT